MSLILALLLVFSPAAHSSASPSATPATNARADASPVTDSVYTIATTRYSYEWVSDIQAWQNRELTLESYFPFGTFVIDLGQQVRFGRNEIGGATHFWADLWGESYGHIHTSIAPNALTMPRFTVGGELYEVHSGWEVSGWFEWRRYPSADVFVMGPQIAKYIPGWYLRLRTSIVEREGRWVATQIAAARYYYLGTDDTFVEGQIGLGKNVELVTASTEEGALEVAGTHFVTARVRHFFSDHLGGTLTAKYSNEVYQRTGVSLGLLVRW